MRALRFLNIAAKAINTKKDRLLAEGVRLDSNVERSFVADLEKNTGIKLYAKLPRDFRIATPLGSYNPDWAVVAERDGEDRLYLVIETKASLFKGDLRTKEGLKIDCGHRHFEAVADAHPRPACMVHATQVVEIFDAVADCVKAE